RPETARIVLTGNADLDSALQAINEAQIIGYVTKPWDNARVLELLGRALSWSDAVQRSRWLASELVRMGSDETAQPSLYETVVAPLTRRQREQNKAEAAPARLGD
ncbi:MAG: hypothetical protein ACK4N5_09440, partial [Myxococcales bacterium]